MIFFIMYAASSYKLYSVAAQVKENTHSPKRQHGHISWENMELKVLPKSFLTMTIEVLKIFKI